MLESFAVQLYRTNLTCDVQAQPWSIYHDNRSNTQQIILH